MLSLQDLAGYGLDAETVVSEVFDLHGRCRVIPAFCKQEEERIELLNRFCELFTLRCTSEFLVEDVVLEHLERTAQRLAQPKQREFADAFIATLKTAKERADQFGREIRWGRSGDADSFWGMLQGELSDRGQNKSAETWRTTEWYGSGRRSDRVRQPGVRDEWAAVLAAEAAERQRDRLAHEAKAWEDGNGLPSGAAGAMLEESPATTVDTHRIGSIPDVVGFVGREAELEWLRAATATRTSMQRRVLVVPGRSGVGKTWLVAEFVRRFAADFSKVIWMRARTESLLIADAYALAGNLGLEDARKAGVLRELLRSLGHWFEDHPRWLLVLDDADDLAVVQPYMPPIASGHVIVTTKPPIGSWLRMGAQTLPQELGALQAEDQQQLIRQQLGDALARRIRLPATAAPLAITQACVAIRNERTAQRTTLAKKFADAETMTATAIEATLGQLQANHPGALRLLSALGLLAPTLVPHGLLVSLAAQARVEDLDAAVDTLESLALCARGIPPAGVVLHESIQQAVCAWGDAQPAELSAQARQDLVQALTAQLERGEERDREITTHAYRAFRVCQDARSSSAELLAMLRVLGRVLAAQHQQHDALDVQEYALSLAVALDDRASQAALRLDLADTHFNLGDRVTAERLAADALAILPGSGHEQLEADAAVLSARIKRADGKLDEAVELLNVIDVAGVSAPTAVAVLVERSIIERQRGQRSGLDEALAIAQEALRLADETDVRVRAEALLTRALAYGSLGHYETALADHQEVRALLEGAGGQADPVQIAMAKVHLSVAERRRGDVCTSVRYARSAHDDLKERLGPNDRTTLVAADRYASALWSASEINEGLTLARRTLEFRIAAQSDPLSVARSHMTLAGLEREAGMYDQAVHNAETALRFIDVRLGGLRTHGRRAKALTRLGHCLLRRGDTTAAVVNLRQGARAHVAAFGDGHPATLHALIYLALGLLASRELDEASTMLDTVLSSATERSRDQARARRARAMVALEQQDFDLAAEQLRRAERYHRESIDAGREPADNLELARTNFLLGQLAYRRAERQWREPDLGGPGTGARDSHHATRAFHSVLRSQTRLLGPGHPDTVLTEEMLGASLLMHFRHLTHLDEDPPPSVLLRAAERHLQQAHARWAGLDPTATQRTENRLKQLGALSNPEAP